MDIDLDMDLQTSLNILKEQKKYEELKYIKLNRESIEQNNQKESEQEEINFKINKLKNESYSENLGYKIDKFQENSKQKIDEIADLAMKLKELTLVSSIYSNYVLSLFTYLL